MPSLPPSARSSRVLSLAHSASADSVLDTLQPRFDSFWRYVNDFKVEFSAISSPSVKSNSKARSGAKVSAHCRRCRFCVLSPTRDHIFMPPPGYNHGLSPSFSSLLGTLGSTSRYHLITSRVRKGLRAEEGASAFNFLVLCFPLRRTLIAVSAQTQARHALLV